MTTATNQPSQTLAAEVLTKLRDDIIWCRLKPGASLRFEAMKDAYGVSFSTLREALSTLVATGLVVTEGQRGFQVAPVSRSELLDLTETRVLVERQLLALAIKNGGDDWEIQCASTLHRMSLVLQRHGAKASSTAEWKQAHAQFHLALVSASASPLLLGFRSTLYDRAERYRSLHALFRKSTPDKANEHKMLLEATLSRSVDKAQKLIDQHIRATTHELFKQASALFDD